RGAELEREFSFGVARQLFEPVVLRASPSARDELLTGAAAAAGPLVGAARPPRHDCDCAIPADALFHALHGLYRLTANVAVAQPLLVAIDDLQWCDAGSLRWLAYLGRRVADLSVLVVVGVHVEHPGAHDELLAEAIADAHVLRPAPLGGASVALLARDALAADPCDELCATCHAATGGNPLLVHALLQALAEEGVVPGADEAARVREIGSHAVLRLLRLRLARLAPEASKLASAVAILGDGASVEHAAALAGLTHDEAAAAATMLGQAGLLALESALSFAHPLERAAIYEAVAPLEREAAHAHAARILASEHACVELIAAQLLYAPSHHEPFALSVLRDTARAACSDGAADTAAAYLRRALREPLQTGTRVDVLVELGMVEKLIDPSAAVEHLREALALLEDDRRGAQVGRQLAQTMFLAGRSEEAVRVLERAIAALGPDRGELRSRLRADLLGVTLLGPELYPIAERQLRAIDRTRLEDGLGERMLLAMTAYCDARRGRGRDASADRAELALADGALLDEEPGTAFSYACRVLVVADRFAAAAAAYERGLDRARARGSITSFAIGLAFRGGLAIHRGALADAEADERAALDAARAGGVAAALPFSLTYLALALLEQGRLDAAEEMLEQFAQDAHAFGDMPFFLLVSGQLRRARCDARGALETTLEAADGYAATGQRNPALAAWRSEAALAQLDLGDRDAARELAADEVRLARAWGAPRPLCRALRVAGLAEGGERGLALLREALAVVAGSAARLERAKALVELGAAVRRGGGRSEARTLLRGGLDLADACGALALAERARSELRAAGSRPRHARVSGVQALTPSERRVAAMAAEGRTNPAIARALFVTAKTVEAHLSSTYRKLDISSRMQLPKALTHPADGRRGAPEGA
ncbi:MAG: hypothetical protein QOG56_607, partial [Solirubrobacteraceae bacterium]|nr:hypothetical protein [Solirubrobacteraceae bacterium]